MNKSLLHKAVLGGLTGAAVFTAASAQALTSREDFVGEQQAHWRTADRTIELTPRTRWVNVRYGETVRFLLPQTQDEFVWRFDGTAENLRLSQIAAGRLPRDVMIYIDQSANPITHETQSG